MKKLPFRLLTLAGGATFVAAGFVIACSSDDTVVPSPEAGVLEAGTDVSSDTNVTTNDGGGDGGNEASAFDAGLTIDSYTTQVGEAACSALTRCCYNDPNLDGGAPVDGGTFNKQACVEAYRDFGFNSAHLGLTRVDKSRLALDQQKGLDCIAKLKALTCGNITPADNKAISAVCYAAIFGKQTAGQPCTDTFECALGHFCNRSNAPDGGPGAVCEAVRAANAPCGNTHDPALNISNAAGRSEYACSFRGSGDTNRYCEYYDIPADGGQATFKAVADWKCTAARADNADCSNDAWCTSGLCNATTFKCSEPEPVFYQPEACTDFLTP